MVVKKILVYFGGVMENDLQRILRERFNLPRHLKNTACQTGGLLLCSAAMHSTLTLILAGSALHDVAARLAVACKPKFAQRKEVKACRSSIISSPVA